MKLLAGNDIYREVYESQNGAGANADFDEEASSNKEVNRHAYQRGRRTGESGQTFEAVDGNAHEALWRGDYYRCNLYHHQRSCKCTGNDVHAAV